MKLNANEPHNCKQIIQKVFLVLDGEMSDEEEKTFLQQITQCPRCLEMFSIEKSFKEFLVNKIGKKQISPAVIASIKEMINRLEVR